MVSAGTKNFPICTLGPSTGPMATHHHRHFLLFSLIDWQFSEVPPLSVHTHAHPNVATIILDSKPRQLHSAFASLSSLSSFLVYVSAAVVRLAVLSAQFPPTDSLALSTLFDSRLNSHSVVFLPHRHFSKSCPHLQLVRHLILFGLFLTR